MKIIHLDIDSKCCFDSILAATGYFSDDPIGDRANWRLYLPLTGAVRQHFSVILPIVIQD